MANTRKASDDAPHRERDLRPIAKADVVADAVTDAAAVLVRLAKLRLWADAPEEYADLRRRFSVLPDDIRRRTLLALLRDEGARVEHDRDASFNAGAA